MSSLNQFSLNTSNSRKYNKSFSKDLALKCIPIAYFVHRTKERFTYDAKVHPLNTQAQQLSLHIVIVVGTSLKSLYALCCLPTLGLVLEKPMPRVFLGFCG